MIAALRKLDAQQTPEGIALSDPLGLSQQALLLSPEAYYIATLFDGEREIEDIQELLLQRHGSVIPREKIAELASALEQARFLETDEVKTELSEMTERLLRLPREMVFAGSSYPSEKDDFLRYLEFCRAFAGDVGRADKGLIMPHLEPARVPGLYGSAVAALSKAAPPQRLLIIGVAHSGLDEIAAALPTPLKTPMGELAVDLRALQALDALLPFELFNSPLSFLREHSIEFPAVFASGAWVQQNTAVMPLLVDAGLSDKAKLDELALALSVLRDEFPFYPLVSVDLSHVGARFGHGPLDSSLASEARKIDSSYLQLITAADFTGAWNILAAANNQTNIDAYGAVQAASRVLGGGALLGYELSPEAQTLSAVAAGVVAFN